MGLKRVSVGLVSVLFWSVWAYVGVYVCILVWVLCGQSERGCGGGGAGVGGGGCDGGGGRGFVYSEGGGGGVDVMKKAVFIFPCEFVLKKIIDEYVFL